MQDSTFSVQILPFSEHPHLRDKVEGQRTVAFVDEQGEHRGELIWRVASGYTVEICEFGIHRPQDRRKGWGSRLLQAGLADMREDTYGSSLRNKHTLRRVWLLTEDSNEIARAFYVSQGFHEEAHLPGFYEDGEAILCVMDVD